MGTRAKPARFAGGSRFSQPPVAGERGGTLAAAVLFAAGAGAGGAVVVREPAQPNAEAPTNRTAWSNDRYIRAVSMTPLAKNYV
jgi:hypothetical protein